MKWHRNRFLPFFYFVLLAALVAVGCTSKEDPSEVLPVCGNHSCGDLVMVTTDTSSDGFQYLNPSLSPDGTRILFSADWWALPTERDPGDELFVNYRQMILMPVREGREPELSLADQGAQLIYVRSFPLTIAGGTESQAGAFNLRKEDPIWRDDNTVIYRYSTRAGYRLIQADITDPTRATSIPLFMEATDANPNLKFWQHMNPALSPDGRWLAFTRSGCVIPDSFETCTRLQLWVLNMETAGLNAGYGAQAFPVTEEYSWIEWPRWSPDSRKIVFSGGLDVGGNVGLGTEIYTVDLDTTGLAAGAMALDNNVERLTFTTYNAGDPISGVFNTQPVYSPAGDIIYFVSTRRAPSITLHDRNIWKIPADGSLDPEIFFFSREDDWAPSINPDGSMLFSSKMGFPTEMLDRLEEEAYQRILQENIEQGLGKTEVEMREEAAGERELLSFFGRQGVMSHLFIFRP